MITIQFHVAINMTWMLTNWTDRALHPIHAFKLFNFMLAKHPLRKWLAKSGMIDCCRLPKQPKTASQCKPFSANIIANENDDKRGGQYYQMIKQSKNHTEQSNKKSTVPFHSLQIHLQERWWKSFQMYQAFSSGGRSITEKVAGERHNLFRKESLAPIPSLHNIPYCPRWSHVITVSTKNCIFVKIKPT